VNFTKIKMLFKYPLKCMLISVGYISLNIYIVYFQISGRGPVKGTKSCGMLHHCIEERM